MIENIIYTIVAFFSTLIGAISGMGGGIIMKPVFDIIGKYGAFETGVLTSSTMLAMSMYSVCSNTNNFRKEKENSKIIAFVALGSLFGGLTGDAIFREFSANFGDSTVKTAQNAVMLALVITVIIYMSGKKKTLGIKNKFAGLPVGLFLGVVSSFLGIGGGPVNVAVLTLVFGFSAKTAVICSLSSVFLSQLSKIASIAVNNGINSFAVKLLPFVVIAGVFGAAIGRMINKKASDKTVERLFMAVQVIVIVICTVNILRYSILA